jgi:hypothetical protein
MQSFYLVNKISVIMNNNNKDTTINNNTSSETPSPLRRRQRQVVIALGDDEDSDNDEFIPPVSKKRTTQTLSSTTPPTSSAIPSTSTLPPPPPHNNNNNNNDDNKRSRTENWDPLYSDEDTRNPTSDVISESHVIDYDMEENTTSTVPPDDVGTFAMQPRNLYYIQIAPNRVMQLLIYIKTMHLPWFTELIFQVRNIILLL